MPDNTSLTPPDPAAAADAAPVQPTNTNDWYYPSDTMVADAHVPDYEAVYARAKQDPLAFWAERALELDWYQKWDKVLDDSNPPFYKWFVGGKTNIVLNALDRHVTTARRNKLALIWEGEPGDSRTFSYYRLWQEVNKFANVLRSMGVGKGDRVTIYMGRVPEMMIAMLSCAKIGAVHNVVFGGFSAQALADRIADAQSRVLITQDGTWIRGKITELKPIADEAVRRSPVVEHVVVYKRTGNPVYMEADRDYWWHDLMALPIAANKCETAIMDSEDPLFILYTSGSTGKPKGILHTHGGYQVYISTTLKWVFDIKDEDRYWCTADPGWITGHSYVVYAPLILGATQFIYEGAPTHPYPNRFWKLIEYYAISIFYTAPTAVRALMRFGDAWPNRHDLSSLRLLGSVGEPINPEAWKWFYDVIGKRKAPIMDTWWQTETGGFMITPLPSTPLKPGSATRPFPGIEVDVLDEKTGEPSAVGTEGLLVIKKPWPSMLRTIYGDPERYKKQYWSRFPGMYLTGDAARRDEDGYIWIIGRTDDMIKVSGHLLGSAEIESGLVSHPAVVEAAAIDEPDELRGSVVHAYCILRNGFEGSPLLEQTLKDHIRREIGPLVVFSKIEFVPSLPKTRSGKIMRRVLRARAQGLPEGDISTLEE